MIEIDFGCTKRLVISSFLKYFRSWFRPWLHRHNDVRDPLITGFFFSVPFLFFFFILPSSERRFFNRIPRFRYGSAIAWNLANPPAPPLSLSLSFCRSLIASIFLMKNAPNSWTRTRRIGISEPSEEENTRSGRLWIRPLKRWRLSLLITRRRLTRSDWQKKKGKFKQKKNPSPSSLPQTQSRWRRQQCRPTWRSTWSVDFGLWEIYLKKKNWNIFISTSFCLVLLGEKWSVFWVYSTCWITFRLAVFLLNHSNWTIFLWFHGYLSHFEIVIFHLRR